MASQSEITIDTHAIAAAIDASDALGLAGSGAMTAMLDKARTCRIRVGSSLVSGRSEAKDAGPQFDLDIPARGDGSPCLNALADAGLYNRVLAMTQHNETLANVHAYWGEQKVGFFTSMTETLYPPRQSAVRKVIALLNGEQVA